MGSDAGNRFEVGGVEEVLGYGVGELFMLRGKRKESEFGEESGNGLVGMGTHWVCRACWLMKLRFNYQLSME